MRLIPAIDIIDGKCVRLSKGDYNKMKIYNENPLEVAKIFEDNGLEYLHLVDLDGAKSQHIVNYKVLENICNKTKLKIDFGGGLKSDKDLEVAFECGANQITAGSIAVKNSMLFKKWLEKYGNDKIILGADCKNKMVVTNGWLENSKIDIIDFIINYEKEGIKYVICTDVSKDGMLQGTSNELYQEIKEQSQIKLIASGGISCIDDLLLLKDIGCNGAIIGKALYENRITLEEIKKIC